MAYRIADYGTNVNAGKDRNNAQARGWGPGWPNCQWTKFVIVERAGVRLSVRREIAELTAVLMTNTERMGYDIKAGQTWGTACRPIRGTNWPSNHSWGLAVDINSLANPMAAYFQTDIPPKVIRMWEACGWYWGGRWQGRVDTMHLEYVGRPSDVPGHLAKAKSYLKEDALAMVSDAEFKKLQSDVAAIKEALTKPVTYTLGTVTKSAVPRTLWEYARVDAYNAKIAARDAAAGDE